MLAALAVVFAIGVLQETIQVASQGIELFLSSTMARAGFDLLTDLIGGFLGLAAYWLLQIKKKFNKMHQPNIAGGN